MLLVRLRTCSAFPCSSSDGRVDASRIARQLTQLILTAGDRRTLARTAASWIRSQIELPGAGLLLRGSWRTLDSPELWRVPSLVPPRLPYWRAGPSYRQPRPPVFRLRGWRRQV